jgi:hypothetical protein
MIDSEIAKTNEEYIEEHRDAINAGMGTTSESGVTTDRTVNSGGIA